MYRKSNHKKNIAYKNVAYIIQPNKSAVYFKVFMITPFGYRVLYPGEIY